MTESTQHIAEEVKEKWVAPSSALVHWDGKIMPTLAGSGKQERLPVLLSGVGGCKLLGAPPLPHKDKDTPMGTIITDAVVGLLEDAGVADNVVGMVFDTTATNTGQRINK